MNVYVPKALFDIGRVGRSNVNRPRHVRAEERERVNDRAVGSTGTLVDVRRVPARHAVRNRVGRFGALGIHRDGRGPRRRTGHRRVLLRAGEGRGERLRGQAGVGTGSRVGGRVGARTGVARGRRIRPASVGRRAAILRRAEVRVTPRGRAGTGHARA